MARIRCKRFSCNSTDISNINKKDGGFSVSKGVLGGLLTDSDFGILAGIEPDEYIFRCNKCGKQWKEFR